VQSLRLANTCLQTTGVINAQLVQPCARRYIDHDCYLPAQRLAEIFPIRRYGRYPAGARTSIEHSSGRTQYCKYALRHGHIRIPVTSAAQYAAPAPVHVNANWRMTFAFEDGNAQTVDYEDYH
jgi:hypothetical protein